MPSSWVHSRCRVPRLHLGGIAERQEGSKAFREGSVVVETGSGDVDDSREEVKMQDEAVDP